MPKGLLLQSPCARFYLQLIEPEGVARYAPMEEHFQRIGLGTPDVIATTRELEKRGIEFLATEKVRTTERGALTAAMLGGVMFELVHQEHAPPLREGDDPARESSNRGRGSSSTQDGK
jgi:4-hydroxyphenylpyruvate dioxygenase